MVRLNISFATWSKAVDNGTLPEIREWLRAVERQLDANLKKQMIDLLIYGVAKW